MKKFVASLSLALFVTLCYFGKAQCGNCELLTNVINNGDFSNGNSGFSTDLSLGTGFFCPLCPEGTYAIGSFAFFYHSDFTGQDHTNPPNGQFMIVNGTAEEGIDVWCQQVEVQPNTNYTLRFFIRDVSTNSNPHPMGVLQASFNGELTGTSIVAQGGWQEQVVSWNSGELTEVEVCIQNFQSNSGGNDFGLDDISMTACHTISPLGVADAGPDIEMCQGEVVTLGSPALPGYTYSWSWPELLQNPTSAQPTFSWENDFNQIVTYSFFVYQDTAGLGCITSDEIVISIYPNPSLSISGNLVFCENGNTELTANGQFNTIQWSNGSQEPNILVFDSGEISATAALNICEVTETVFIEEIILPEINLGPDVAICETLAPYIFTLPQSVLWSDGSLSSEFYVEQSGTYWAMIEQNGCIEVDSVEVEVDTFVAVETPQEMLMCDGESVEIVASQFGTWSNGESSESISVNEAGVYTISVQNGQCNDSSETVVIEKFSPAVSMPNMVSFCEGESVIIEPISEYAETFLWSDGSVFNNNRIDTGGWHILEVSNDCGVARDSTLAILEFCETGLYIPNAFTPDGNGINDGWVVKGTRVSNVKIFIYNRLGDLIWFSEELEDPWIPDERDVGIDAYTYRVEAINYFGEAIVETGHIRLLR